MNSKTKIILALMILTLLLITACGGNNLSGASTYSDAISDQIAEDDCPQDGDTCPIDFGTVDYKETCGADISDEDNDGVCDVN